MIVQCHVAYYLFTIITNTGDYSFEAVLKMIVI